MATPSRNEPDETQRAAAVTPAPRGEIRAGLAPEARVLGRYRLRYRLARGGMASVYLAKFANDANSFTKWIALKVMHPHLVEDARFVRMFLREARLGARLNHPNICAVLDFGEADGTPYLAMEYLHGAALSAVLRQAHAVGGVPVAIGVRIVADAARGLHAAHELRDEDGTSANVVHRDVSPQNIFVLYEGTTKVVDFGVARATDDGHLTTAGEVKGKFAYMAPEQVRGDAVDRRADIFALGVVLWETTVGQRLFAAQNDASVISAVLSGGIRPPSAIAPDYPPELEQIVMRALARSPAQRFQTANELARALEGFLARSLSAVGPTEVCDFMTAIFADRIAELDGVLRQQQSVRPGPPSSPSSAAAASTAHVAPTAVHEQRSSRPAAPRAPGFGAFVARAALGVALLGAGAAAALVGLSWLQRGAAPRAETASPLDVRAESRAVEPPRGTRELGGQAPAAPPAAEQAELPARPRDDASRADLTRTVPRAHVAAPRAAPRAVAPLRHAPVISPADHGPASGPPSASPAAAPALAAGGTPAPVAASAPAPVAPAPVAAAAPVPAPAAAPSAAPPAALAPLRGVRGALADLRASGVSAMSFQSRAGAAAEALGRCMARQANARQAQAGVVATARVAVTVVVRDRRADGATLRGGPGWLASCSGAVLEQFAGNLPEGNDAEYAVTFTAVLSPER